MSRSPQRGETVPIAEVAANSVATQHVILRTRSGCEQSREMLQSNVLRRFFTILLLAIIGLPLAAPLFAASSRDESSLPACCRRNGKHHCMGGMEMSAEASSKPAFRAPKDACPYAPTLPTAFHRNSFATFSRTATSIVLQTHDTILAQTECKLRISRSRSRQKRGPPTISVS
jgi:hypothetical protein